MGISIVMVLAGEVNLCDLVTREGVLGSHRVRAREWGKHWDINLVELGLFVDWSSAPLKDLNIDQASTVLGRSVEELTDWAQGLQN